MWAYGVFAVTRSELTREGHKLLLQGGGAEDLAETPYMTKAVHVKYVQECDWLYRPMEGLSFNDLSEQCPVFLSPVHNSGYLGFIGDVNGDPLSDQVVLPICKWACFRGS